MPRRRFRFRPPGVHPWTRIGPLGPFRGRLGIQWVIAALIVAALLLVLAAVLLFRNRSLGTSSVVGIVPVAEGVDMRGWGPYARIADSSAGRGDLSLR